MNEKREENKGHNTPAQEIVILTAPCSTKSIKYTRKLFLSTSVIDIAVALFSFRLLRSGTEWNGFCQHTSIAIAFLVAATIVFVIGVVQKSSNEPEKDS